MFSFFIENIKRTPKFTAKIVRHLTTGGGMLNFNSKPIGVTVYIITVMISMVIILSVLNVSYVNIIIIIITSRIIYS